MRQNFLDSSGLAMLTGICLAADVPMAHMENTAMTEQELKPHPRHFEIFVDGERFETDQPSLNGAQIKALAQKDSTYQLFEELHGSGQDKLIRDTDVVQIKSGLKFYTVPPATFGR